MKANFDSDWGKTVSLTMIKMNIPAIFTCVFFRYL